MVIEVIEWLFIRPKAAFLAKKAYFKKYYFSETRFELKRANTYRIGQLTLHLRIISCIRRMNACLPQALGRQSHECTAARAHQKSARDRHPRR
jgi:hypothetical protein